MAHLGLVKVVLSRPPIMVALLVRAPLGQHPLVSHRERDKLVTYRNAGNTSR